MIYITNRYNPRLYNEQWDYDLAIVRYSKQPAREKEIQLAALSPSKQLLDWVNNLKKEDKWNDTYFKLVYVPAFLQEMQAPTAKAALNKLYLLDKQGKKIAITCFCSDETGCHRNIIAGLLQGAGCNVELDSEADYRKYYEEYKSNTQTKVTFE